MDHAPGNPQLIAPIIRTLGRLLNEAAALGLGEFVLVQHDRQDDAVTTEIERTYAGTYRMRREAGILRLADIPRIYGGAALVLSNRLHCLLVGLQSGAVGLALIRVSEERKIQNQFLDVGLGDHIVDLDAADPEVGAVRCALDRRGPMTEAVAAYRDRAVTTARATVASLFSEG
jgi:hypothetical protein